MSEQNAPAAFDGQGGGQAANAPKPPESGSGQGNNQQDEVLRRLEQQTLTAQQKITELGQQNSSLVKKLESFEQMEQQRRNRLAAELGFAEKQEQINDVDRMLDDPEYLTRKINELAEKKLQPILTEREVERSSAYLQKQIVEKENWVSKLKQKDYSDEIINEVLNLERVFPDIATKNRRIQEQYSSGLLDLDTARQELSKTDLEMARRLEQVGGLDAIVKARLGDVMLSKGDIILQEKMRKAREREILNQRNARFNKFKSEASLDNQGEVDVGYKRKVGQARIVER